MNEQLNIEGNLEKLSNLFGEAIDNEFNVINSELVSVTKYIPSKFGYTTKKETVRYKIEKYLENDPLKWGFSGEYIVNKMEFNNNPEYIVPDREAMDEIVKQSINEFDAYIHATLAKMTLLGHTTIFYPINKNPEHSKLNLEYYWKVDDSCISPKGNSVTHILLYPLFFVAHK